MFRTNSRTRALARSLGVAPHKVVAPSATHPTYDNRRSLGLIEDVDTPLVLIIAGAGFGKTTLLSRCVEASDRPFAWLDVDEGDNDPIRLLRGIVASLADVADVDELERIGRRTRLSAIERALESTELLLCDVEPFVLIIDDAHLVTAPAALDVLDGLMSVIPRGSRLVMAGRAEPAAHTARRGLDLDLTTIRARDLKLSTTETVDALTTALPDIDADVLGRLAHQIDGWPAGLQFATLALRDSPYAEGTAAYDATAHAELPDLARNELLAQYFQQEFLAALSPESREFLVQTSFLERLSGDLCDHVTGGCCTASRLRDLVESGNAFVVPIGHDGLFRYHALFAEFLLTELRVTMTGMEAELRCRAVDWYERHGEWEAAVRTALRSNGLVPASPLIMKCLVPRIASGEIASIGEWLSFYDHDEIAADPVLALAAAWFSLFANQRVEMERWLREASAHDGGGPLPDGTRDIPTAVAAVRMLAGASGAPATARWAKQLRDAGPDGGPWYGTACLLEATALAACDEIPDLRKRLEEAEFMTRAFPPAHAVTLAHLGLEAIDNGDHATATREIRAAVEEIRDRGLTEMSHVAAVFSAQALLDAHRGDHASSTESAAHASELLERADELHSRSHLFHNLVLADAAMRRSDWKAAARHLRIAKNRLPHEPDAVVLRDRHAQLAQRYASRHDHGVVLELTSAEQRVLEQLASHRTLSEIGEYLFVSRNTVKTHTMAIYRKLFVSGRSDAIKRAVELGLIDPRLGSSGQTVSAGY